MSRTLTRVIGALFVVIGAIGALVSGTLTFAILFILGCLILIIEWIAFGSERS